ncbi:MAG: UDP-N-acetylmuramate--alanine ligase [Rhodospirillales bacterium]|nr:UDP-N-acetylmuramate--alanine ligase [Rhodospirillales bacterium]MCB9980470.1 UDP-N-acetylmuramate--alanine ligase [Rhodospirillales bacterium]
MVSSVGAVGHLFFCGIGGSGMMPLALIARGFGYHVSGSDRTWDQGLLPEKFQWLRAQGIELFPQDGSGITIGVSRLIVSTAVEDHIPDIKAARTLSVPITHRSELLAEFFNQAPVKIAIAGTSGKTTVTGMTGYLLKMLGKDPVVMNGGIFKNFAADNPYCTALTGRGDIFVTESDESDGSISRYHPDIAVVNNIALDHKPMSELLDLFGGFIARAKQVVLNLDNAYCRDFSADNPEKTVTFSLTDPAADLCAATLDMQLSVIGDHNVSNALAALGVAKCLGLDLQETLKVLRGFQGIKRRLDVLGTVHGITVIDDFGHNPDKISASLAAVKKFYAGRRMQVFFQPHGFALLRQLHRELAEVFRQGLSGDDRLYLVDPYYAGGTADRSVTSADMVADMGAESRRAVLCENRDDVKQRILHTRKSGDVIVVMGARDDTLSQFAADLYHLIGAGLEG